MRTITKEKLAEILEKHRKWLNGDNGGGRANLFYANLPHADLSHADFSHADFSHANLFKADLSHANLSHADFSHADFSHANLFKADFSHANLFKADLSEADLSEAIITNTILNAYLVCPEEGEFIAWKCGKDGAIIKLSIPADAQRMTSLVGRKCRTDKAVVLEIRDNGGNEIQECGGWRNNNFIYRKGETVIPDSYDPDIRIECSHGIHFFITKQEAVD